MKVLSISENIRPRGEVEGKGGSVETLYSESRRVSSGRREGNGPL